MKTRLLFGVTAIIGASALWSCSDKLVPDENEPDISDRDRVCYVNVAIALQDPNTRAGGTSSDENEFQNSDYTYNPSDQPNFEYGTVSESEINNIVFVFFNKNGEQVGEKVTVPIEGFSLDEQFEGNTTNIGDYYKSIVPVTILKGQEAPTQLIAFVNPSQTTDLDRDLKSIMTTTRTNISTTTKVDGADKTFLSMANSVYFDENITDGNPNICRAAQIPEGGAFTSREDAEKEATVQDSKKITVVNVERYAAKVRMKTADGMKINDYTPGNSTAGSNSQFKLQFVPSKWALNAIDDRTFVTKVFLKNNGFGTYESEAYTYDEANSLINANGLNWKWNSFDLKRSYWGLSPQYYKATYPEVASDWNSDSYDVDYVTYSSLIGEGGHEAGTSVYARETTVGTAGFTSNNPAASIPSIVYGGHYEVKDKDGNSLKDKGKPITFYIHKVAGVNNIFFEPNTTDGTSLVEGGTSVMQDIIGHQGSLFIRVQKLITTTGADGTTTQKWETTDNVKLGKENLSLMAQFLEVKHPDENVLNGVKVPSRKVTVQIKSRSNIPSGAETPYTVMDTNVRYVLCYGNGSTIANVTASTLTAANRTLTGAAFYADKYQNGAAYFNIPILHLGWYRAGNPNWKSTTDKSMAQNIDWDKVRVGDFGLVRNHVYDILINSISGLGTGVGNPDDPIIPENNGKTYYVNFRLNILNWAVVPVQKMDL